MAVVAEHPGLQSACFENVAASLPALPFSASKRVFQRKRVQVSPEISRGIDVLRGFGSGSKGGIFMVAVIIPERSTGPSLQELVLKSAVRMQPLGVERAGHLLGNQRWGIEPKL